MNLEQLPIPSTCPEIVETYKELKHICFENWCVLPYDDGHNAKLEFLKQIQNCFKSHDANNAVRACIGASIMFHYSTSWVDSLTNIFANLEAGANPEADKFICMSIAKFSNKLSQSSAFIIQKLKSISKVLTYSSSQSCINHSMTLLKCLEKYATHALESCSLQFYEHLQPLLFCDKEEIRVLTFNILSHFLRVSRRADFPSNLYKEAKTILDNPSATTPAKIHGALLTFAAICDTFQVDFNEGQASQQMKVFWAFSFAEFPQYIRHAALLLIVILAPFDEQSFYKTYKDKVVPMLWSQNTFTLETVDGFHYLMRKTPEVFEKKISFLLVTFRDVFRSSNPEILEHAVQLLNEFIQKLPSTVNANISKIASFLISAVYTNSLINTLQLLFEKFPNFWPAFKQYWYATVSRLMDNPKTIQYGLRLLQILPEIENPPSQLIKKIKEQLIQGDLCNRKLAPAALVNALKHQPMDVRRMYGKILLNIAVTSTSPEIRKSALQAFKPPYSHFLAYPDAISTFEILIKDGNQQVRMEALKILGGISEYNPTMIYPMFRSLILDTLFICDSSKSSRVQADAVKCLPIIFSSVPPLLPIYGGQFVPIAIQQLHVHLKTAMINEEDTEEAHEIVVSNTPASSLGSTGSLDKKSGSMDSQKSYIRSSNSLDNIKFDGLQLSSPNQHLSFFERTFSTEIAADLIDTIKVIAGINFTIIEPYINEITSLFIDALGRATHNSVILAILNALNVIVEKIGPLAANKITRLNSTLIALGSKSDSPKVHSEIFKILGQIGLVQTQQEQTVYDSSIESWHIDLFLVGSEIEYEDYFIYVIFKNLHPVLTDRMQQELNDQAHSILSTIFTECEKTSMTKRMFNNYIKTFLIAVRNAPNNEKGNFFQMWRNLLSCPSEWLQQFAGNFVQLIEELWDTNYLSDVVSLIPALANSLKEAFAPYIPQITTLLLNALSKTQSNDYSIASYVLEALTELSSFASNFVFIIIRQIVDCIFNPQTSPYIVEKALCSLRSIVQNYNCAAYSSLIARVCFYSLGLHNNSISDSAIQVIYSLAVSMGPRFSLYRDLAQKSIIDAGLSTQDFEKVANLKTFRKPSEFPFISIDQKDKITAEPKVPIVLEEDELLRHIEIPESLSVEYWKNWMQRFQKAIVEYSPSRAFRTASVLTAKDPTQVRKFFEPAFLSVWINADEELRKKIMKPINIAMNDKTTPMSVLTTLVGLFEFMDRTKQELPKPTEPFKLTRIVLRAEKPTYALHCAELDYEHNKNIKTAHSSLIQIYNQLGMFDEARGFANKVGTTASCANNGIMRYTSWDNSIKVVAQGTENFMSSITELEAKEKWEEIAKKVNSYQNFPVSEKDNASLIFAHAFYHLDEWEEFDKTISSMPDNISSLILLCMAGIKRKQDISSYLEKGFSTLGAEAGPLFAHGMTAVAPFIVYAQRLVELGEATKEDPSKVWADRLSNNGAHFNMIRNLLLMRCEILGKEKSINEDLALLKIARRSNEWDVFTDHFIRHFEAFPERMQNPRVVIEYTQLLWKKGDTETAFNELNSLIERLQRTKEDDYLLAKLFMMKAKWKVRSSPSEDNSIMDEVRSLFGEALKYRPNHYTTNNMWAWANMRLSQQTDLKAKEERAIDAIISFSRCVNLDPKNCFADLLQLSSILFRTCQLPNVFISTKDAIEEIPLKHFITILPQLVVYQYTESQTLKEFVDSLLTRILSEYPNAAIFTLLFSANNGSQNSVVKSIISSFEMSHASFVNSAKTILNGFIKACVTYKEFINEAVFTFIDICKKIGKDDGFKGEISEEFMSKLIDVSTRLVERIKDIGCLYDKQVYQKYKDKLLRLSSYFEKFLASKNVIELFMRGKEIEQINNMLFQETERENKLVLSTVAPELAAIENSPISVFGTFKTEGPQTTILQFSKEMGVIHSKQRPKQVKIIGSDHKTYRFLLKGHEDLRQDQRVMQFFELVNSISHKGSQRLTITSITPLTTSVGLIQWLPGCDTMNDLITEYRKSMNISIALEFNALCKLTINEIDRLLPIQRYEALRKIAKETPDDDLKSVMWLKSPDAESWASHTIAFAKSTALMSIVGYIIGLGDRHPSNIMIQRFSGSVIHIDFGDCFEVTAHRAHLAEHIPFRLTRMIVKAFGECGVDGSFRRVCEETTQTLRENREAVMAVLEIFFREPLTSGKFFDRSVTKDLIAGSFSTVELDTVSRKQLKEIMNRIRDKVRGTDNGNTVPMSVHDQVDWLINSARDHYNLASLFHGWSPLW